MSIRLNISDQKSNDKKLLRKNKSMSSEDAEVLMILQKLKDDLAFVHNNLDCVTNPILIDSYIYEIQALHMKYKFYLQLCKEKGLAYNGFVQKRDYLTAASIRN